MIGGNTFIPPDHRVLHVKYKFRIDRMGHFSLNFTTSQAGAELFCKTVVLKTNPVKNCGQLVVK